MDRLSQELIGFDSRYVVKYYDVIERKNELWARGLCDGIARDGELWIRFPCNTSGERKSVE